MAKRITPTRDGNRKFIGPESTSFGRRVELVNPTDRNYTRHRFVLHFGAYGWTRLMVCADSLDDAIEIAAEHLAAYAPGHVMKMWGDEHKGLIKDVCEEKGIAFPDGFEALEDEVKNAICDEAEADLTRTESGFLTSYEWGVSLEDPTRAELDDFLYPAGIDWTADRKEV
jgi:hypothetical protein